MQSRVNPERAKMMKPYVEKTKHLSEQQIKALADFIMTHLNSKR
jgi:cytochrome c553